MKQTTLTLLTLLTAATINADNVTLSAYIYPYTLTPNAPIVLSTTDAKNWSDGIGLYLDEDGKASAFITGETDTAILQGIIPSLKEWSYLSLVIDGNISSFYINNILQDSAEITPAFILEGNLIVADDGYVAFDGEIRLDEASITEDSNETELKVESVELKTVAGGLPSTATATATATAHMENAPPYLNTPLSTLNTPLSTLNTPPQAGGSASTLNTSSTPLFIIHCRLE